jgi:hypothetical protein
MEHAEVQSRLSDYLDGALPPAEAKALEGHLAGCAACQHDLALLRRSIGFVRALPRVTAPPDFASQVRRRAHKAGLFGKQRRRDLTRWMVPWEATLVVVIATMGALVIFLLLIQDQLVPQEIGTPPPVVGVEGAPQVNQVAQVVWQAGGAVYALGRLVPPQSPLGAVTEIELAIPPASWGTVRSTLAPLVGPERLPAHPPPVGKDGRIRLIVQIVRSRQTPSGN